MKAVVHCRTAVFLCNVRDKIVEQIAAVVGRWASGWYCTLNTGRPTRRMPTTVLSFKWTWVSSTSRWIQGSRLITNPWFWEVISHVPVIKFLTGWFTPR